MSTRADKAWNWLQRELDRWAEAGLQARFWWRDDDASAPSDALDRLLDLCAASQVPLALAVIPARLHADLPARLSNLNGVCIMQHGYAHRSHAGPGERKLELAAGRDRAQTIAELQRGHDLLRARFTEQFLPVLVPPWNRIDPSLLTALTGIGLRGISTMKARDKARPAPGLLQVNAHLDPVHWRSRRGFIGIYPAIAILIQHLVAKRTGYRDDDEATGLLTHHLEQNDAVWYFTAELFEFINAHPAATWCDAPSLWAT